jgi:hypothetical protein
MSAAQVAAMSEEISAQTEEFSALAQSLGDMAASLSTLIGYFKLTGQASPLTQVERPVRKSLPLTLVPRSDTPTLHGELQRRDHAVRM